MKLSAFTFIKNGEILGYPFIESILSVLPIVDEFVINVGESEDDTLARIKELDDPKIRIIESKWNDNMRDRGYVYAQQKMIAQFNCTGDWAFYIEGDEVMHEDDLEKLRETCEKYKDDDEVEAIAFDYYHFYGNANTYLESSHWYRSEPRIIKNSIRTYAPDGLFWVVMNKHKKGRYPKAVRPGVKMYHYGHARSEEQMNLKFQKISKYWNEKPKKIDYNDIDPDIMRLFTGTHPKVVQEWLTPADGLYVPHPANGIPDNYLRYRKKDKLEKLLGKDLSKRHYIELKDKT